MSCVISYIQPLQGGSTRREPMQARGDMQILHSNTLTRNQTLDLLAVW